MTLLVFYTVYVSEHFEGDTVADRERQAIFVSNLMTSFQISEIT